MESSPTVPEPSGMLLLLCGITGFVVIRAASVELESRPQRDFRNAGIHTDNKEQKFKRR
jgi:hypothetical protein